MAMSSPYPPPPCGASAASDHVHLAQAAKRPSEKAIEGASTPKASAGADEALGQRHYNVKLSSNTTTNAASRLAAAAAASPMTSDTKERLQQQKKLFRETIPGLSRFLRAAAARRRWRTISCSSSMASFTPRTRVHSGTDSTIGVPRKLDQLTLFFDAPEEVMLKHPLHLGKTSGHADDNTESVQKRNKAFLVEGQ